MQSHFQYLEPTLTVRLEGDLIGGADAMTFSKDVKEAIQQHSPKAIIVDAEKVEFVNSSGLGMLLAARQAAHESGADLRVTNAKPQLRSLLDLTKLSSILGAV
jgi:anti-sigma B factor antagonist